MSEQATQPQPEQPHPVSKYAPGERALRDIIADLRKPIHATHLGQKTQGGRSITFLPWYYAVKYLDLYAPGWQYEIMDISHYPAGMDKDGVQTGKIAVRVRLSIPTADGVFFREAIGNEDDDKDGYGDPFSNSEAQALRRAAAKWGLGLYLYDKK